MNDFGPSNTFKAKPNDDSLPSYVFRKQLTILCHRYREDTRGGTLSRRAQVKLVYRQLVGAFELPVPLDK